MLKPNGEIHKHILEKYNLKAGKNLFIDDVDKNVEGARKLNINAEIFKGDYEAVIYKYNL